MVNDLLNPAKTNLKVRESTGVGVWIDGVTEQPIGQESHVYELLELGDKSRAVSATKMNATSSRSHSLVIVHLVSKLPDGTIKTGTLNLCDLAGKHAWQVAICHGSQHFLLMKTAGVVGHLPPCNPPSNSPNSPPIAPNPR